MSSRRPTARPVVVEVAPDNATYNLAPSSPPSPKAVRFAPTSDNRLSRPLTSTEAWSLYYFESHARHCATCYQPLEVYRQGARLCDQGHGLAADVACHVYHRDGDIYSVKKDDAKLVRVEIPHGYTQLRSLLKAMEHGLRRSRHRSVPIYSYDRTYPVPARRPQRENVVIEPASSTRSRRTSSSKQTPTGRYATVQVDDAQRATTTTTPSTSRRGGLYDQDMQRKPKDYRVEIRDPSSDHRRRKSHHRDSGIWI